MTLRLHFKSRAKQRLFYALATSLGLGALVVPVAAEDMTGLLRGAVEVTREMPNNGVFDPWNDGTELQKQRHQASLAVQPLQAFEACRVLSRNFTRDTRQALAKFEGPGFALRLVTRPSNRFRGLDDVAVLVGENHFKDEATALRGQKLVRRFRAYGIETGDPTPGVRGLPVQLSPDLKISENAATRALNLHGSTIVDLIREVLAHPKEKLLFPIEGADLEKPVSWRANAAMQKDVWIARYVLYPLLESSANSDSHEEVRDEVLQNNRELPAQIAAREIEQRRVMLETGKPPMESALISVRNTTFAQNIGLIFARMPVHMPPVLALMGAGHMIGVKNQLMLYQGFREILPGDIQRCAASDRD